MTHPFSTMTNIQTCSFGGVYRRHAVTHRRAAGRGARLSDNPPRPVEGAAAVGEQPEHQPEAGTRKAATQKIVSDWANAAVDCSRIASNEFPVVRTVDE
jgi:hypothetical protein